MGRQLCRRPGDRVRSSREVGVLSRPLVAACGVGSGRSTLPLVATWAHMTSLILFLFCLFSFTLLGHGSAHRCGPLFRSLPCWSCSSEFRLMWVSLK